jgi:hypothetical protein
MGQIVRHQSLPKQRRSGCLSRQAVALCAGPKINPALATLQMGPHQSPFNGGLYLG